MTELSSSLILLILVLQLNCMFRIPRCVLVYMQSRPMNAWSSRMEPVGATLIALHVTNSEGSHC